MLPLEIRAEADAILARWPEKLVVTLLPGHIGLVGQVGAEDTHPPGVQLIGHLGIQQMTHFETIERWIVEYRGELAADVGKVEAWCQDTDGQCQVVLRAEVRRELGGIRIFRTRGVLKVREIVEALGRLPRRALRSEADAPIGERPQIESLRGTECRVHV